MRAFDLVTLGTGAALPARGRHPSAQLLDCNGTCYLIDCGEGTQERLRQAGINFERIERVLISHLHGDHYLGLMGLMSTMHLLGRTRPLYIHAPEELKAIIALQLKASGTFLRYPYHFQPTSATTGTAVFSDERVQVVELALRHRIPTTGYLFTEQQAPRKLRAEEVDRIPHYARNAVKAGQDLVLEDGTVVPVDELTHPPDKPRSYAYCSDTMPCAELIPLIQGVDLLYHEATFLHELLKRAKETMHSTAQQAAELAQAAGVKELLLGHFSSRYHDPVVLLEEARHTFPATRMAEEGQRYRIGRV